MKTAAPAQTSRAPARECVALRDLTDCLLQAYDTVARRAYEKFLARGGPPGKELGDWREAERELLTPLPVDVAENGDCVTALASVPGYSGAEIEVGIESRWLVILGARAAREDSPGPCAPGPAGEPVAHVFSVIELPAEVDPARSVAVLSNGLLGIRMPKSAQLPLPGMCKT